jgi:hypothetical protein
MGNLSNKAANKTNTELRDEEAQLLLDTRVNLEDLRPKVSDQETYDALIAAVDEATRHHNDLALLKSRVKEMGEAGIKVFNKIKSFLV